MPGAVEAILEDLEWLGLPWNEGPARQSERVDRHREAALVVGVCVVGSALAWYFGRSYDVLTLGERTAAHLGVPVERLRMASVVVSPK